MDKDITGEVVNYCTYDLLANAINSIRKYYPNLNIVVIDNTPKAKVKKIKDVKTLNTFENLGHGTGLNIGISLIKSNEILIFDSDIIMKKPCIEEMYYNIGCNYGIGNIITVNKKGFNDYVGIKYLHPHFCMINRSMYYKYHRFIHHGAPFIKTMIELDNKYLVNFDTSKYIAHLGRGTVNLKPKEFMENWET